jgi:predicted SAM-dependent methyltransferase
LLLPAKPAITAANKPFAKGRANRAFAAAQRPMKLEIAGNAPRAGWVVTNVGPTARNYLDACSRWPLEDGSCSFVFSDNMIEHVTLAMARTMLAETYRCLQPGGVTRIVTPDLRRHVELYLDGTGVDDPIGRRYAAMGLTVEHPIDLIRIPIATFGHHIGYLYDFETLDHELRKAGFSDVRQVELGISEHPELCELDIRPAEGAGQLVVEAIK